MHVLVLKHLLTTILRRDKCNFVAEERTNIVRHPVIKSLSVRQPGWLSGLAPPLVQGVILGTRDPVPHWSPCMEPASPSACVSLSLSWINKLNLKKIKNKKKSLGHLGGSAVERLPLARGMISESRDRVPCRASCTVPAYPSACVSASLCVCLSWINK